MPASSLFLNVTLEIRMKFSEYVNRTLVGILSTICVMAISACQNPIATHNASVPENQASKPVVATGKRFMIDPQLSEIRLLVYRDGPMARFGHNHVINGHARGDIHVSETSAASGFRIEVPVDTFTVDEPALRSEEGPDFEASVSDQARRGTRENMLGEMVLDAVNQPLILIESVSLSGPKWNPDVVARVTIRGRSSEVRFPAAVFENFDGMTITATFRVMQSELGIQPFSILGGAVRVRDAIDIRVHLVAKTAN